MAERYCKDCVHFIEGSVPIYHQCKRVGSNDLVTGSPHVRSANIERVSVNDNCGEVGRYFEPRLPQRRGASTRRPSWFEKFLNFIGECF